MKECKLVVLGSDWDVYQYALHDLIVNPEIVYLPTFRPQGIAGAVHRLHFNPRINKIFPLPFHQLWNRCYLPSLKDEEHVCFLILENWLRWESKTHYLPYLRQRYPKALIVCFLQDLVTRIEDLYSHKTISTDYLKHYCDSVITYDVNDAQRYGLTYFPTVYSQIEVKCPEEIPASDLYFLGRDKGRFPTLLSIYHKATALGLKCEFFLLNMPEEQQVHLPGLHYISQAMSYETNLQYASRSRCIIEMLQPNALGATFRLWETISLNTKLLTNNRQVLDSPFYDAQYISVFTQEEDIDWEFITNRKAPYATESHNPYIEKIKPESLLRTIEQELHITLKR